MLNYAQNVVLEKPIETSDTNEQLARKNGLNYSEKLDIFFRNYADKSRYIESLYKEENDTRSNNEVATDNELFYSVESKRFFEDQKEYELFQKENMMEGFITPTDIAEADMDRKVSKTVIDSVKNFFNKIVEKLRGKGER